MKRQNFTLLALFVKDTAAKTRPPFICVAQAASRIGATLGKIKQI
nr:hypothetical protein [uncultured Campylobacter sp.]